MKGLIVLDIPKTDCRECQCFSSTYPACGVLHRYIDPIPGQRPVWCPIKPVPLYRPEKIPVAVTDLTGEIRVTGEYVSKKNIGYNECLEELLQSEEEHE